MARVDLPVDEALHDVDHLGADPLIAAGLDDVGDVRKQQALLAGYRVVVAVDDGLATSMRSGFCKNRSASFWISGGMVAEKNSVWRVKGMSLAMRSISGMKPMSSMRSASSMTRISTPVISSLPRSQ